MFLDESLEEKISALKKSRSMSGFFCLARLINHLLEPFFQEVNIKITSLKAGVG
jgi:hypothetical protein